MVEVAPVDKFIKKILFTVQGKGGNIGPFKAESDNLGIIKKDAANTQFIELVHPLSKKIDQLRPFSNLENVIINDPNQEETLIIFYFTGESYLN